MEFISEYQKLETLKQARQAIMVVEARLRHDILGKQMEMEMMKTLFNMMDVAEVYSFPRVAAMAKRLGFRDGWSFDLTTCDTDGREWDFNVSEMKSCRTQSVSRQAIGVHWEPNVRTFQHHEQY